MFENFKTVYLATGLPSMSITSNGVTFSKAAISKLCKPTHVLLLMNEAEKQFAIKVCDKDDEGSTQFLRNKSTSVLTVRWNNKDLLHTISVMMDWSLEEQGYRITGDYYGEEAALLFDLKKAVPIAERGNDEEQE